MSNDSELTEIELGEKFTVAVGQQVCVEELAAAINLSGKNVRLLKPETKPPYGEGSFDPMRRNIHVDGNRCVTRINFG